MANIYAYTQTGELNFTAALSVGAGPLDYLGAGMFLCASDSLVRQLEIVGKACSVVKTVYTPSKTPLCDGIAATHQRVSSDVDFECLNFFFSYHATDEDPPTATIDLIGLKEGQLMRQYATRSDGPVYAGLLWDGMSLWSHEYDVSGGSLAYSQFDVTSGAAQIVRSDTPGYSKPIDIAFTGVNHIAIDDTTTYFVDPKTPSSALRSWVHGLTGALGVTFDGQFIYIAAD